MSLSLTVAPVMFAVVVVSESANHVRRAQRAAGASATAYWLSHFIADLCTMSLPIATIYILFACFDIRFLFGDNLWPGIGMLLAFAVAVPWVTYATSFLFSSAETAQTWCTQRLARPPPDRSPGWCVGSRRRMCFCRR